MEGQAKGYLIIIGGAEDKTGKNGILNQAHEMLSDKDILTIITTATEKPQEVGENYKQDFAKMGVKNIQVLDINTRDIANSPEICEQIKKSKGIFMTGGDQLRVTSILGGTAAYEELKQVYFNGGIIMGTSAGASVMSSTMVVQGEDNEPAKKCTLKMAPGFRLLENSIIDQHFDQRGRFGRLLCGVAENPEVLGIGIDEDTAIKVYPDNHFEIIGTNTVTIIDGTSIKSSNVSELAPNEMLAIIGVTVHTLPKGYGFNLLSREVMRLKNGGKKDGSTRNN
ncbi:MAG: cyanophycinase [Bacillales bacterium]|jgi:cyanophycinase|nr:cyanophycinase [Bacillales bacterium]